MMVESSHLPNFEGMLAPVVYRDGGIDLLDQTRLPQRETVLHLASVSDVAEAIRTMRVRGAPAIGITAAYGFVLGMQKQQQSAEYVESVAETLRNTRPTAVNLTWAVDRMLAAFHEHKDDSYKELQAAMLAEATHIHKADIQANRAMGQAGADLLPANAIVITICNTGALATGGYGTAYGVLRAAHEQNKLSRVYACETRPRLQGARLTAWELLQDGIPFRLIVDSAAASVMTHNDVDAVIAGADRIAANGDTANKIGTYPLAVVAKRHDVPFYIVAPTSTIDVATPTGASIPIEERPHDEVLSCVDSQIASPGVAAWNPAFDVTPAELITGIITENGVQRPPFRFLTSGGK